MQVVFVECLNDYRTLFTSSLFLRSFLQHHGIEATIVQVSAENREARLREVADRPMSGSRIFTAPRMPLRCVAS